MWNRSLCLLLLLISLMFGAVPVAAQLTPLKVGHNSFTDESVLYLGRDAGLFKKHGIHLELIFIPGGSLSMQALIGKSLDLLLSGGTPFVYAQLKGADLKIIAGLVNKMPYAFVARENINSAEQLKGKKVGISRFGSNTDFVVKLALTEMGLQPKKDVQIIQAGGSDARMVALRTGAIDATVLTPELAMITHRFGSRTLLDFVEKGMEYQHIALMGRSDFLKSQTEPVKRFMRGYLESIQYYFTHRDEAIKKGLQLIKSDDRQIGEFSYDYRVKILPRDGKPTFKGMQLVLDAAAEDDPKAKSLNPQQLIDLSFLP